ncbi:Beta-galactosidase BoGH2A [Parabacteroides sp. ASF519]|uniref:glycoside hydrolase family 2 protein n=1 Tax=Parabacteroides sp. ASF519 TaxID=1235803 RepID=UPI00202D0166|nr:glycoside hydrolase family 2 TIM barrel-domain containing protein [Parabacteroides sp. ASF519]KAI4359562.1 Beta-galactosidase BoGH2A [Parabacteroides sp. ASF519]
MKRLIFTVMLLLPCLWLGAQSQRERELLNQDWLFAKGHAANPEKDFNYGQALSFSKIAFLQESTMLDADQESRLAIPHTQRFDDSKWEKISLPHDWGMALGYSQEQFKMKGYRKLGGRAPENSVGWYRKRFTPELVKGNRYTLEFEGIFRDAQVWMNGVYLGRGESGYVPLVFDVTECLNYEKDAENVISVRVDATHSELWSYEGAGIYRNVWLTRTAPVHIPQWGTFVTSEVDLQKKEARVKAQIEVTNQSGKSVDLIVQNSIIDCQGKEVNKSGTTLTLPSLETKEVETYMDVRQVDLWSLKTPTLYTLHTDILLDGAVVDSYDTSFGIRDIRFDANEGFFLNGERVQIQGVCCHQDHAGVGIAVPDQLNAWRIARLKEYGVNAYRASHNPPTESVLNACDTLGMLVMDELRVLSSSDEGLSKLKTIIRRDRNHPSVIIWCLGNEEPAIQGTEKGRMIVERMKAVQRKLDPTRPCTAAMNGSWGKVLPMP